MTKRRGFLIGLFGLGGLAAGGLGYGGLRHLRRKQQRIESTTGELVNFLGSRDLGNLYLAAFPEEADSDVLVAALFEGIPEGESPKVVRKHIQKKIVDDYDQDRVKAMDGWVLSVTELRLFALASKA